MIKLLTHNDLDGFGCIILAWFAFGRENVDYVCCDYKTINNEVLKAVKNKEQYEHIYITDISISLDTAEAINKDASKITLLDHHPTVMELNKYDWASVIIHNDLNIKTSGTELFFLYLSQNKLLNFKSHLNHFVRLVRDYDTWRWKEVTQDLLPKQLNDILYIIGREDFLNECYKTLDSNNYILLNDQWKMLLDVEQKRIDSYINRKNKYLKVYKIHQYNVGIVFADNHISELGNRLCEMHPEIDFVAMLSDDSISYRSIKDEIDCGAFAKYYNGGGHPKAAGMSYDDNFLDNLVDLIFR